MSQVTTLWTDAAKKFKPRNFQAARITFRAKGMHVPPPDVTPNLLDQRQREFAALQAMAEEITRTKRERAQAVATLQKAEQERQKSAKASRPAKNMWLARHLKRQAKLAGKPKPTREEIRAALVKFRT